MLVASNDRSFEGDRTIIDYLLKRGADKKAKTDKGISCEQIAQIISVFGGGYFGFSNIYSLDSESDFYILNNQRDVPENYIAIADNGCGDYYVIRTENGYCQKKIFFYEHEAQQIEDTEFMDIFEFLVAVGLKYNK